MSIPSYSSVSNLSKLILSKEVKSEDVVRHYLKRISKYNEQVNAIVILFEKEAIEKAKEADRALNRGEIWGPLHGVPVTVKEAFNIQGVKTTVNVEHLAHNIADEDAVIVKRLKDAGAIIIGKTNVPPNLSDYQTDGPIYGRTNNPYDLARTPGGSGGGGAAAVAAGLTPLDIGSDIAGSIRVPSNLCGVYALKPTEFSVAGKGHVPPHPNSTGGVYHMGVQGPIATSVPDLELVFDIIKGGDPQNPSFPPIKWEKCDDLPVSSLNIAWSDSFADVTAGVETREALRNLLDKLDTSGIQIAKVEKNTFDFAGIIKNWGHLTAYILGQDIPAKQRAEFQSRWATEFNSEPSMDGLIAGLDLDYGLYTSTLKDKEITLKYMQEFFKKYDFWICPVTVGQAFTHRRPGEDIVIDGANFDYNVALGSYARVFSFTGNPAIIIPVGLNKEGLPIGLQIVGPHWSEAKLFKFAGLLAELTEGFIPPKDYLL